MEVGTEVWIKDSKRDFSWIPAVIHSKVRLYFIIDFFPSFHDHSFRMFQNPSSTGKLDLVVKNEYGEDYHFM